MKTAIVIPARRGSTRLKDKLLLKVKDKPVIAYTVENCLKVRNIDRVIVACDDDEFKEVLKEYPIDVILTPSDIQSGSDRIAYVIKDLDYDFIVNVQADEPLLNPVDIEKVAVALKDYPITTLAYPITEEEDYLNPNVVKVVLDRENCGIYFSRSPIPFYRDIDFNTLKNLKYPLKHIGIYGYRKDVLLNFAYSMEKSPIEEIEKLEQLRLLYNGYKIKIFIASKDTIGIDTKEDFERFCTLI
ncbi:MAG: 3-deoxy-manno-octulosonate cytidylyltransferase [Hydrogenothermaceae bacterium]